MSGDVQIVAQRFALPTSGGATSDFTIPALGFTPKAVEIIAVNATTNAVIATSFAFSHGYADASNQGVSGSSALDNPSGNSETSRCYSESLVIRLLDPGTTTVDGAFSFNSFIANGVRLNNSNFPSAANFALMTFFGGSDLSVAVRNVLLTGSSPSISSLGFDPNFALFAGIETAAAAETQQDDAQISHGCAVGPTVVQRSLNMLFRNASFNASASGELSSSYVSSVPGTATQGAPEYGIASFDTGGLTFNRPVFGVDMRCTVLVADTDTCGVAVGSFNPPTFDDTIASTGDLGFEPGFVGMGISRLREVDEYNSNVNSNMNYLSRFDGTREFTIGVCGEDNARPDDNRSWCDAKAFSAVDEDDAVFFDGSFEDFRGSPNNDARIDFATTSGTQRRAYFWAVEVGSAPPAGATLVVQDASHAHSADNIQLFHRATLAVNDSLHAHSADALLLFQRHTLAVNGTDHAHQADTPSLSQGYVLTVADTMHGHDSESPVLIQAGVLVVNDSLHDHSAANVGLFQRSTLTVNDTLHGHAAESPALTVAATLAVDDALHGHAADQMTLSVSINLVVADASHGHAAESPVLTQANILVVDGASHTHLADNLNLNTALNLVVQGAAHTHLTDSPTLTQANTLSVDDASHAHAADLFALLQADVDSAVQAAVQTAVQTAVATALTDDRKRMTAIMDHDASKGREALARELAFSDIDVEQAVKLLEAAPKADAKVTKIGDFEQRLNAEGNPEVGPDDEEVEDEDEQEMATTVSRIASIGRRGKQQ